MASIQIRKETGNLIIDFYYGGTRCREQTALPDNPANRKRLQKLLDKIEAEIAAGTFDYRRFFPNSKQIAKIEQTPMAVAIQALTAVVSGQEVPIASNASLQAQQAVLAGTPLFREFAETWYSEKEIEWRKSHKTVIRDDLDKLLIPHFGEMRVGQIAKADVLAFRASLAKVPARKKNTPLSNARINKIMNPLRQILNEAADRFDFRTVFGKIKQLKVPKSDVQPFTLVEVKKLIDTIRVDFRNYLRVRFFTGMRTGEVHGLQWKYVDFDRRLILIRETIVDGEDDYTKNDYSQRDIQMNQVVFDALKAQQKATGHLKYVFSTRSGEAVENRNFVNRVWRPLLRHLKLPHRRPYQCRHTAATLWLAAGEAPEWIARQMGHSTTEMLFRVYSRFVPNLTRNDGSAFERLLLQSGTVQAVTSTQAAANDAVGTVPANDPAPALNTNNANNLNQEVRHG